MKRLALVLAAAAAALGTGCGPSCPSGTTFVSWNGFDGPDATTGAPCGPASGVYSVDLWLDNQLVGNFPCADYGEAIPGVPTGGNILDVEGIAGDGTTILFRDELSFSQAGCDNVALQAFPGAGMVELDYSFAPTNACSTPAPTYMWLQVSDDIAGQIAFTETGMGPAQVCAVPNPPGSGPAYSLPNGSFTLVGMEEVQPGGAVVGADCTAQPFTVGTGQVTSVAPVLLDSTIGCF